jgi:hypothetical protein
MGDAQGAAVAKWSKRPRTVRRSRIRRMRCRSLAPALLSRR